MTSAYEEKISDRGCSQLQNERACRPRGRGLCPTLIVTRHISALNTRAFVRTAAMLRKLSSIIAKSKAVKSIFVKGLATAEKVQIIRTNHPH